MSRTSTGRIHMIFGRHECRNLEAFKRTLRDATPRSKKVRKKTYIIETGKLFYPSLRNSLDEAAMRNIDRCIKKLTVNQRFIEEIERINQFEDTVMAVPDKTFKPAQIESDFSVAEQVEAQRLGYETIRENYVPEAILYSLIIDGLSRKLSLIWHGQLAFDFQEIENIAFQSHLYTYKHMRLRDRLFIGVLRKLARQYQLVCTARGGYHLHYYKQARDKIRFFHYSERVDSELPMLKFDRDPNTFTESDLPEILKASIYENFISYDSVSIAQAIRIVRALPADINILEGFYREFLGMGFDVIAGILLERLRTSSEPFTLFEGMAQSL